MPLLYALLAWCAGLYWASQAASPQYALSLALLAIAILCLWVGNIRWQNRRLWWRGHKRWRLAGWAISFFALALLRAWSARPPADGSHVQSYASGQVVALIGVVDLPPEQRDAGLRLRIAVEQIDAEGGYGAMQPVSGAVYLYPPQDFTAAYGDRLRIVGQLAQPPRFDAFDYRDYLARQGIYGIMARPRFLLKTGADAGNPLLAALYGLRNQADQLIRQVLPAPQAPFLAGILLGTPGQFAPEVAAALRETNTSHLIAISGSNIALVAGLLTGFWRAVFGQRKRSQFLIAGAVIIGLVVYTIFVGASASVVRAAIMGCLTVLALAGGRVSNGLTALAMAVLLMTLLSPSAIFDLGLLLSALATLGLICYGGALKKLGERYLRLPPALAEIVMVGFAAQITTLPLTLLYSGAVSPLGFVVNILIAPAQASIMVVGGLVLAAAALPIVGVVLAQALAWVAWLPLSYTLGLIRGAAALSEGVALPMTAVAALFCYGLLAAGTSYFSLPARPRQRWRAFFAQAIRQRGLQAAGLLATALVAFFLWAMVLTRPDGKLHLWLIPSQTGVAVLVQTPDGAHLLLAELNTEPDSRLLTGLGDYMPFYKNQIDILISAPAAKSAQTVGRYQIGAATDLANGSILRGSDGWQISAPHAGVLELRYGGAQVVIVLDAKAKPVAQSQVLILPTAALPNWQDAWAQARFIFTEDAGTLSTDNDFWLTQPLAISTDGHNLWVQSR
jgi:competence protein ComEC